MFNSTCVEMFIHVKYHLSITPDFLNLAIVYDISGQKNIKICAK